MNTHELVESQLLNNDPPEVRQAVAHLERIGVSRHRAIHLVANGLVEEIWRAKRDSAPFDTPRYRRHLEALCAALPPLPPGTRAPGRNDRCPWAAARSTSTATAAPPPWPRPPDT